MSSSTWRVLRGYATYQRTPVRIISGGKWAPLKSIMVSPPCPRPESSQREIIPQITSDENLRQNPVRSWVFPGNTADVTTIDDLKADLRGWRLNRSVFVGDSGMFSEANRQRLSRALGRYILAVPMRKVTEVPLAVLTRAGRYRNVADNLRVKEVYVGEGERRRRYVVCHNPDEAAREQAHREHVLELVRAELATLDVRQADHPKKACELMASRRFGRYLRLDTHG